MNMIDPERQPQGQIEVLRKALVDQLHELDAEQLVEQIQIWDREHRAHHVTYRVPPSRTPADQLPAGRVLHTKHRTLTISWAQAAMGREDLAEPADWGGSPRPAGRTNNDR